MSGIAGLAEVIKNAVQKRVDEESRARRGRINNGRFESGADSYPCISAVDVDTSNGARAWAQLSKNRTAVIVGS